MKCLTLLLISFCACSCQQKRLNTKYILETVWNYDTGFRAGEADFIFFDQVHSAFELKGDTIFYKGSPCALIVEADKKKFNLRISSMDGKNIGTYRDENEGLQNPNK